MEYKNEIIEFDEKKFYVIDTEKLDFSNAKMGIKSKITKVYNARGGEKIITRNKNNEIESVVIAKKNDAIFYNNDSDMYIPTDSNGNHWKFDKIETYGYKIVKNHENYVEIQSNNKALLLVGCVEKESVIKDAFGKGQHQFLYQGATIKKDIKTGAISGIDKVAFESTWKIIDENLNT